MLNTVAAQKPAMLSLASKAVNVIFRNPSSVFLTAKVRDILFDGVVINCTVTDFAAKAVCTQLKTEAKDLKQITPTDFAFSFLGPVSDLCKYVFLVASLHGPFTDKCNAHFDMESSNDYRD